jgi:hypothetical protein
MITEDRSMTILIILIMAAQPQRGYGVTAQRESGWQRTSTSSRQEHESSCLLMLKSIGSYSMATKAQGTLFLILENQHASWDLMMWPPVRGATAKMASHEACLLQGEVTGRF